MTSATGARPSNSQCEESKGRNSISSSRPSGSVSSCGSHQDTRTLGDGADEAGMGRAARRDSPSQSRRRAEGAAQDVVVGGVHQMFSAL